MYFEGTVRIESAREAVWEVVNDLLDISQYIPGLKSIEEIKPGEEYSLVVMAKLGAMTQTFRVTVRFTDADPPGYARLQIRGKSSKIHIGATSSLFLMEAGENQTDMKWSFVVSIYGQVATLSNRVVEGVVNKVSSKFLKALTERIQASC